MSSLGSSGPDPHTEPIPVARAAGRGRAFLAITIAAVLVGIVVIAANLAGGDDDPGSPPPPPDGMGTDLAITVEGDEILRGGQPWWFLGYNSFVWSGDCGDDDEKMTVEDVDAWFASMRHDGHGAARLFFFEGWDVDRLDAAVESAKRHDIYLTITLDDAIAECGESEKDAEWFADESERDAYRSHMTSLLERYRGETTIAWFEYFNEPDFVDGALREFYDEMGAVAESVDPDRLFASGTIAPYALGGDENFRTVHESPGVDIASLHEYDEGEVESNHGPDTRASSAGKPVIVGEFGIEATDAGNCPRDFAARAEQFGAKAEAYTTIDGYVGGMAWSWQPGNADECVYENLPADAASQQVLRTFTP